MSVNGEATAQHEGQRAHTVSTRTKSAVLGLSAAGGAETYHDVCPSPFVIKGTLANLSGLLPEGARQG